MGASWPSPGASEASGELVVAVSTVGERALEGSGTDGASVSLTSGSDGLSPFWASDPVAERLEERQLTLGEGPCLEAVGTRAPILVDDLRDINRRTRAWPVFVSEVGPLGVGGIFAFPVQIGVISLGCLELYRGAPGALSAVQLAAALSAADAVAAVLLDVGWRRDVGEMIPPYRRVVHQAAGMMTVQLDVTIEEAMMRLRARAYSEERSIGAVAADIVAGTLDLVEEER